MANDFPPLPPIPGASNVPLIPGASNIPPIPDASNVPPIPGAFVSTASNEPKVNPVEYLKHITELSRLKAEADRKAKEEEAKRKAEAAQFGNNSKSVKDCDIHEKKKNPSETSDNAKVDIILLNTGPDKFLFTKSIVEIADVSITEVKELVDSIPCTIVEDIEMAAALQINNLFELIGAKVEIIKHQCQSENNQIEKTQVNDHKSETDLESSNIEDVWIVELSKIHNKIGVCKILCDFMRMSLSEANSISSKGKLEATESQAKQLKKELSCYALVNIRPLNGMSNLSDPVEDIGPDMPLNRMEMVFNIETGTLWFVGNGSFQDFIKMNKKSFKEFEENSLVTKIKFKGSIEKIWGGAFSNKFYPKYFKNLQEVVLPEGLEEIPAIGFCDCSNLEKITLPDSLKYIASTAFDGCKSLCEVINLHPGVRYSASTFKKLPLIRDKVPVSQG